MWGLKFVSAVGGPLEVPQQPCAPSTASAEGAQFSTKQPQWGGFGSGWALFGAQLGAYFTCRGTRHPQGPYSYSGQSRRFSGVSKFFWFALVAGERISLDTFERLRKTCGGNCFKKFASPNWKQFTSWSFYNLRFAVDFRDLKSCLKIAENPDFCWLGKRRSLTATCTRRP